MSNEASDEANLFHAHLDACKHCEENPFNLCAEGAKAINEQMGRATAQYYRDVMCVIGCEPKSGIPVEGKPAK